MCSINCWGYPLEDNPWCFCIVLRQVSTAGLWESEQFSLVSVGKEENLFCSFLTFENRLVITGFSHSAASITTAFLETSWKWDLLWRHLQQVNWTWQIGKTLSKITFFRAPRPRKWRSGLSFLICCRLCQRQHVCQVIPCFDVLFEC